MRGLGGEGAYLPGKMQPPAYLQLPRCQGNTLGSPQFNTRTGSGGKRRLYCHVLLSHSPSPPTPHAALVLHSSPSPGRPSSTPGLATPTQPSPQVSPLLTPAPLQAPSTPTPVLCPLPWARPTLNSRAKASPTRTDPNSGESEGSSDPTYAQAYAPPKKPGLLTSCPRLGRGRLWLRPHRVVNTPAQSLPPRGPRSLMNCGALAPPRGRRRDVAAGRAARLLTSSLAQVLEPDLGPSNEWSRQGCARCRF